ncbi:MAG: S1 RNA-binding domain-containing protein, partial [Polyangiaceae bacterium]
MNNVTPENAGEEDFAALLAESFGQDSVKEGEILRGTVIAVGKDYAIVDVGYKSEGQVPLEEFRQADGTIGVQPGDVVDVLLESRENDAGMCVLSKEKADRFKVWDEISAACERDELIEGVITARVKGGLSVTIRGGVKAFLPGSQVDLRPVRNLDAFLNQSFKFKVIKFNKKRGNIVLSRRVLLEKERAALKESTLERLKEGQLVEGIVKNLTEYGAFIDLGGIDGLLHITDMSWGRVNHPSELFQVGDHVRVKVLKFNADTERVSLGLKQITEDPWSRAAEKYVPGTVVRGKVVKGVIKNITEYGAFVDLGGIDGLLHITDMSWGRVNHPSELFQVGDEVTVRVLKYNAETERVSLGMKQTQEDPWSHAEEAFPPGKKVKGKVQSITDYGAFIELEPGVEGLVHVSEMSWTKKVKHPSKLVEVGQELECQVLEVDAKAKRISLGLKQLEPDPWSVFTEKYKPGDKIGGKVRSITDYGVFIGIEEGVDGMVHKSDISWTAKVNNPSDLYKKGDDVEAIILSINHDEKKVSLGVKQLWDDPWPTIFSELPPGKVVKAKVLSVVDYGVFVRVRDGVEGLISQGDVVTPVDADGKEHALRPGDEVEAEIANIDTQERRITLSMRVGGGASAAASGASGT